ncbi:hypothetical protein [Rhodopirellula sallentina]|uniref:Uncharacterized protein n=1 Tax=Rhodopirellula sallentina SM41 TaxID=1263870 RepID=M5UHD2_9BACT|nr:hypothetical protein [Rhodopirellula sallentina]EMI55438.1 hypothetical protein RSSM_03081 [Rhodopirellula sallentina SM41]
MNEPISDRISRWLDDADENSACESDMSSREASEGVADSILIHGLLVDLGSRDDEAEAERIHSVMQRIDAVNGSGRYNEPVQPATKGTRSLVHYASAALVAIATAVMVMFVAFGPHQSVSAAMASLERVVEVAAKPFDRTYKVHVVEEYPRDKRSRNRTKSAGDRKSPEQIDGATIHVRGADEYVMTVSLKTGETRTSGCDGQVSWAFRENGPVNISTDLNRFRGRMPGSQQDMPFLNIHANLSQLKLGYDVELANEQETADDGTLLSQLTCVRKSSDVRGPKQVEVWFDAGNGTVHKMLLDGLPRRRGGPKAVMLELVDLSDLPSDFFSHDAHHEPGRRVKHE